MSDFNDPKIAELLERLERYERLGLLGVHWFSVKTAAMYCDLSAHQLRRVIRAGQLVVSDVGTPDRPIYRVSREALNEWLKAKERSPKPKRRRKKTPQTGYISRHYLKPSDQ